MKKTVLGIFAGGAVFALAVGLGLYCRFEYGDPKTTCTLCHEVRGAQARMAKAPHKDVNCKECHGSTFAALGDNLKRGLSHLRDTDHTRLDSVFCLNERQVEEVNARCAKCHAAEAAQWAASGHGKPASVFLQDEKPPKELELASAGGVLDLPSCDGSAVYFVEFKA